MKKVGSVLLAGWALGLLGCSGALMPSRSTDRSDISELKRRVLELQEQSAVTQVELDRVRRELALLQGRLSSNGDREVASAEPAETSTGTSLIQGSAAVSAAQPDMFENSVESSDLAPQIVDPTISSVETAGANQAESAAGESAEQTAAVEISPTVEEYDPISSEAQGLYDRGYTLYHQAQYIDAESGFRRFLQIYPKNELSDNAQYWIGECRYARGDIRGALSAFQETVERYPSGNKVPDAILKLAGCLEELGADEAAQARYDEVIRRFPNTAAATLAQERR